MWWSLNKARLNISKHKSQGEAKRVLCVCTAGILRSATAANVLAQEYNYNTRSAGISPQLALIAVDETLLNWADQIVCMEKWHEGLLKHFLNYFELGQKPIYCLNIEDDYKFMSPELIAAIRTSYISQTSSLESHSTDSRSNTQSPLDHKEK